MDVGRYLRQELVKLELESVPDPLGDDAENTEKAILRRRWKFKEKIISELAELFSLSGEIRNQHKFLLDLTNREKQVSTAIGNGIAVPHVRSMQPRKIVLCFARSREGLDYFSPDGQPVHIFFGVAAPSYDDSVYLRMYKWLAHAFSREEWLHDALLDAEHPGEIIKIFKSIRG
jgi:mannitol/fructose-specific phosphotransferase system IIA component (Ntr-type)